MAEHNSLQAGRKQTALRAAYSLAAGAAAGVATSPADAAVVYSGTQNLAIGYGLSQNLNVDGDAFNDIKLKNYAFGLGPYQGATVIFAPGKLVSFKVPSVVTVYASNLAAGSLIDSVSAGTYFYGSLSFGANNPNGQFNNVQNAFIGLSFPSGANLYYGWVRVNINNAAQTFTIVDWAYENTSGVGIKAGDGIVVTLDGDLDGSKKVDGNDFIEAQRGLGTSYDATDMQKVRDHFGEAIPVAPAASAAPEPGALGLLAAGSMGVAMLRRRRPKP